MSIADEHNYYRSFIIALTLHVIVIIFLVLHFESSFDNMNEKVGNQPNIIKAYTVIEPHEVKPKHKAANATRLVSKAKLSVVPKPKSVAKKTQTTPKKQVAFKSKNKPIIKPKPTLTETQKMAQLAKKLQAETRASMRRQLQADQQQLNEQLKQAERTQEIVDKFKAMILQQVGQNWIVPEVNKDISCRLLITLAPGGTVLTVKLVKSSGNAALDRSAIQAVYKASPLLVPKEQDAFNAMRELDMTVRPESAVSKVINTGENV
jgi:colicin import membrane protein